MRALYQISKKLFAILVCVSLLFVFCAFSHDNLSGNSAAEREPLEIPSSFSSENFSLLYKRSLIRFYCKQIRIAYHNLLLITRRDNFRGYCAMYVNNLLVYYGVNRDYIKGNANVLFSLYSGKSYTDSGYFIESISAKDYSLHEALSLFSMSESPEEMILVVFSKGATEKGKEFGHVFFVNAIIGDTVIFSESSPSIFEDGTVPDGCPLILSIDQVCDKYAYYKFEGIIHFSSFSEPPLYANFWKNKACHFSASHYFYFSPLVFH